MKHFEYFILFLLVGIISSLITYFIRWFTLKNNILDISNNRSSHDIPTPKGGGISIVTILFGTLIVLKSFNIIESPFFNSALIGLGIVAFIGIIDDFKSLPISIRAISYIIASTLSVYLIGGFSNLSINHYSFNFIHSGFILSVLFIVWLTNLYNFMDGTDGFAGIQTICVSIFSGLLLYFSIQPSYAILLFCLAASTVGFLYWNWAPARIFMGDVGSCTIGFLFGLLSIYTVKIEIVAISVWLILLAPFICDATYTLLKRIANREKWYEAHNSHAYQKIYQMGVSHSKLAMGLLFMNLLVIWPIAYVAHTYNNLEFAMIILSYIVLGAIWLTVQVKYNKFKKVLL